MLHVSNEFKEIVEKKYREMKDQNKIEEILDEKLGEIKLFINEKPKSHIVSFEFNSDIVYVGSN